MNEGAASKSNESGDGVPKTELGQNFEQPLSPKLTFATKVKVWGEMHKAAWESPSELLGDAVRDEVLSKAGYRCHFCGFASRRNHVDNLNSNHLDVRAPNLRVVDPVCHAWRHLGQHTPDQAQVVYLPGLSPQDLNHLQRTIAIALASGDPTASEDARALVNWLATHREYVTNAWGTSDPAAFAEAINSVPDLDEDRRAFVFGGLALALNPRLFDEDRPDHGLPSQDFPAVSRWGQIYHAVIHAAA